MVARRDQERRARTLPSRKADSIPRTSERQGAVGGNFGSRLGGTRPWLPSVSKRKRVCEDLRPLYFG
jgi:hypothetical protein